MKTKTNFNKSKKSFYQFIGKRILDLIIVIPGIVFLLPIGIIIAFFIKIDTKGPIIYKQKRVGKNTNLFYIYKFRTMVINAEEIGSKSTSIDDKRITKAGKFLRKFSLDELPQLFNILFGEMSLVGYRPGIKENYSEKVLKSEIFDLKPGITGYAQVKGRSSLSIEEKRYWERKYTREISFSVDLKIILVTIKKVIKGESAY